MQQIVAACAAEPWEERRLFELFRRAQPYRDLTWEEFEEALCLLTDGIESSRGRYGAYLLRDRVHGRIQARRGARLVAVTNGGTIPDTSLFPVIMQPEGVQIATLDEDFAVESIAGRHYPAGQYELADSAGGVGKRTGAGGGCAWAAAVGAVLDGRGSAADDGIVEVRFRTSRRDRPADEGSSAGIYQPDKSAGCGDGGVAEAGVRSRRCRCRTDDRLRRCRAGGAGDGSNCNDDCCRTVFRSKAAGCS